MSRQTPLLFCRYSILIDERALNATQQYEMLSEIKGEMVAHRKSEPSASDFDTFAMAPELSEIDGHTVLSWAVGQQVLFREKDIYHKRYDKIITSAEETDEIKHAKFVALPDLSVLAVVDKISDRSLGGKQAASRFSSVVKSVPNGKANIEFSASNTDLQRALDTWSLDHFNFSVRPFNPSIKKPGDMLHDLMVKDGAGTFRGDIKPAEGADMRDSHEGVIAEAKGLSDAGYGQIGAAGVTPEGRKASFAKPKFDTDKKKNLKQQAKPRMLKVYIEPQLTEEDEVAEIVRALLEFYG